MTKVQESEAACMLETPISLRRGKETFLCVVHICMPPVGVYVGDNKGSPLCLCWSVCWMCVYGTSEHLWITGSVLLVSRCTNRASSRETQLEKSPGS